jgi:aspartyl-tRNA(Asn)/glutamyl-tRNA(Gln) amidotransferase subunit C
MEDLMANIIDKKDVLYIANLSKLNIEEEHVEKFTIEFNKIIEYINKLSEVNTDSTKPTSHVLEMFNVLREDVVIDSLEEKETFKNAPDKEKDHFKVPRIVES